MTKHSKHRTDKLTPEMEDRAREIAYLLWEEEGHPDGRHEDHWFRAVEIVTAEALSPDYLKRQDTEGERKLRAVEIEKSTIGRKVA